MKKRKDCFFGVHLDFHSNDTAEGIGENLTAEAIRSFIREVKPDFMQCDVKGHSGYSSYQTKVGFPTPKIQKDALRIWREATQAEDVPLYAHYSGLMDAVQAKLHPDWRVVNKNGEPAWCHMSYFSDYIDELLIPQLKELAVDYQLNGVWMDAECWAASEDYSPRALEAYEASGKTLSFKEFSRQAFRDYVTNYIQQVKAVAPDFELASNWLYTQQAPEKPTVPVDFLSGDVIPFETYDSTKFGSRIIANQHMTWDLMSWSTDMYLNYEKSALQLCVEATDIIAVGGAFQVYCEQNFKNILQSDTYVSTLKEISEYCHAREEYCHKASMRKEVGVLLSQTAYFHERDRLFGRGGLHYDSVQGCIMACLENQYSGEILLGYNALEQDISDYKLIVIPELKAIEPALKEKLLAYANAGGALMIAGAYASRLFAEDLGVTPVGDVQDSYAQLVINGKKLTIESVLTVFEEEGLHTAYLAKTAGEGLAMKQSMFGDAGGSWPLPKKQYTRKMAGSIVKEYGKGKIALIPFDLGRQYTYLRTYQMRDFFAEIAKSVYAEKMVKTNTHFVEIILTEKDGREFVQTVNLETGKKHIDIKSFDEILPLRNVKLSYLRAKKPNKIMRYPENTEVAFTYENGRVEFELDELKIHSIFEML